MSRMVAGMLAVVLASWDCDGTSPSPIEGAYTLVSENGQALPADPSAPTGCCVTLSASMVLTRNHYSLQGMYRNKNTGITFGNVEFGHYTASGSAVAFTRTGGSGENLPYLLDVGVLSAGQDTLTLRYGDEGPGSDQIVAVFVR